VSVRRGPWLVALLILAALTVSVAGLTLLWAIVSAGARIERDSVLVIRLRGALDEVEPGGVWQPFLRARPTLRSLVDTLHKAVADDRIRGLVLVPGETPSLWGKVQELRDAVAAFRRSGKPTVALLEYGGDQEYYLATACEHVFLLPTSTLDLDGLATYEIFLRGTLDKLGIQPDLLHIGDYKTAINMWTEKGFTPAHREMAESLNADTFDELVRGIAEGRHKDEDDVRALIDAGPFLPEDALREDLIDDVAYEDQVDDKVRFAVGPVHFVQAEDYARVRLASLDASRAPRIGVIYAVGTITSGDSQDTPEGPVLGSESLVHSIRTARADESLRAIVLRIDSPGGSSIASDVIWRELMLTRTTKPLVVSMSDLAASGGYYIALPAHAIVAHPGTLTGSIGIYGGKFAFAGSLDKIGARAEAVTDGRRALMHSPTRPYTEDERSRLGQQLVAFYDTFVERVAEARRSTPERIDSIAQGRVWTGQQALALGLVDELGGLERALERAKERAGIPAETTVEVVVFPPYRSLYELVPTPFGSWGLGPGTSPVERWLPPWLPPANRRAIRQAALPWRLYRPGEPLALMPFVVVR
jgi:protease-4